jgi:hypothetical protein
MEQHPDAKERLEQVSHQITFFTDWCIGKTVPEVLRVQWLNPHSALLKGKKIIRTK